MLCVKTMRDMTAKLQDGYKKTMQYMRILNINDAGKNQIFEKQSNLMQKLLKAQYFMNEMHEYEIKRFSKTLEFNSDLPKTSFSTNLSSKRKH